MNHNKYLRIASLLFSIIFFSCSKPIPAVQTKGVQYTIAGNFSGILIASYTTASGGTKNEQITSLPWNKVIDYGANVVAAVIAVSGNGGSAGQQITVVVEKVADYSSTTTTTTVTANSSGSFSQATSVVTF